MEYSKNMSLRPGTLEDLAQVLEIERESHASPWTKTHFVQEMGIPYSRFLVLTDDETDSVVLGYIIYWLQAEGASLLNVTVAQKWRGLGLSRILMASMVNEAVREEVPKVMLEVRESNSGAIRIYEHFGFKKTHERKAFYADGETALVMELKTSEITTPIQ